ncbi:MAG: tetratricopeptide repeat protein [bacterium]|nr:tetratricopeptide repeat protein [bacterium]MCP4799483.1 tetratricopeptide repeat protein [bacterium]
MKKLFAFLFMLIAVAVVADDMSSVQSKARRAIFRSQQLSEVDNWAGSAEMLQECLTDYPDQDHYLLRFYLANSLAKCDSLHSAAIHYQKTVELNPEFINGWLNLAETSYATENYSTAANAFEKGFRLQEIPAPHLLYYAGVCSSLAGENSAALKLLQELIATDLPKPDWLQTTVATAMEVDEIEIAQKTVNRFCEIYPDDPSAWLLAYQFYSAQQDFKQAAAAMTIRSYLQPLTRNEHLQLGDILFASGVPAEAALHYEIALSDATEPATPEQYEMLASALLSAQQTEKAAAALLFALEIKPTARLWSLLGDVEYSREKYQAAFNAFTSATELDPEQGRNWLMVGYCAMETGKLADAKTALQRAKQFPNQKQNANELLQRLHQK